MSLPERPAEFFATPKAEQETWLMQVFVGANNVEKYTTHESYVLYGLPGAGKTALRLFLQQYAPPQVLVIPWLPEPITNLSGTPLTNAALHQMMRALLEWLILHGELPTRISQPPGWFAAALAWYFRRYLPLDASFYIQSCSAAIATDAINWYLAILDKPETPIFKDDASLSDQLRMLMRVLNQAQYSCVWWLVDGLDRWPPQSEQYLLAMIDALLSTLAVFDIPQYTFKLFAPLAYREIIQSTSGVIAHRIRELALTWTNEQLVNLLELRFSLAFHRPGFGLADICSDPVVHTFFAEHGAGNPRQWLEMASRLVGAFQAKQQPLTSEQCLAALSDVMSQQPRLRLIPERQEVQIGERIEPIISETEFKLLLYLYQRPGKICSLEELYFCALKGMAYIPGQRDKDWVHKSVWRAILDTAIYRLRKRIEPSAQTPVYLVTHPRLGLELRHTIV